MPTRISRHVFINKDHLELVMSMLEVFLDGVPEGDPREKLAMELEKKLEIASENQRFTIEVENCYEIVPPGQRLERKLGYVKREKGPRRGKGGNSRRAAEPEGRLEND